MKQPLAAPYWGVRAFADPGSDTVARAAMFSDRMPQRAFYFGRTAAALHRLPLPARFAAETALHVAVPAGERRIDALQIVAHHVRVVESDVAAWQQTAVSSPTRTWCDLAASLSLAELVAVGDRLIWHRSPMTTITALAAQIDRYEGRRGIRLMRAGLELLSDSADSPPESELRVAVYLAGFPPPRVNEEILLSSGSTLHPDLGWPNFRVAIDYEGDHHRVDREQWRTDIRRFSELHDDGWRTYRATGDDYRSPHRLLTWLGRHLPASR
jgi:hypothetical protein